MEPNLHTMDDSTREDFEASLSDIEDAIRKALDAIVATRAGKRGAWLTELRRSLRDALDGAQDAEVILADAQHSQRFAA